MLSDFTGPTWQYQVLVVDDDASILRTLGRMLRRRGYEVCTASGVVSAREHLDSNEVDLVITDVGLRDGSGLDVLAAVARRRPDLPVVLFSGALAPPPGVTAPDGGPVRYLCKPIDEADLLDAIASVRLQNGRDTRESLGDAGFSAALRELCVVFQPAVSCAGRRVVAHEALIRSRAPSLGRPGRLLSAARHLSRTQELGRAIRAAIAARIDEIPDGDIHVNLDPAELADTTLYAADAPLARHADRILFDVRETATLDRLETVQRMSALRDRGYRISLDNLADGPAALSTLAILRPDLIKIDGALVRGIGRDGLRRTVVHAFLDLGRRLGVPTVAAGVETQEDLRAVLELGGDLVQGYVFGQPKPQVGPVDLAPLDRVSGRSA